MASVKALFSFSGEKFYSLFDKVADNLKAASVVFAQTMYDDVHMQAEHLAELAAIEERNDSVTHKLFVELGKNFITPFDREDIHELTSTIDSIIDYMYDTVRQVKALQIGKPGHDLQQLAEQLVQIIKLVASSTEGLRHKRHLTQLTETCLTARKLIDACDTRLDSFTSQLFHDSETEMNIVKKMQLYDNMQVLLNKCAQAMNVVETVVVKYG
jgi:uncharacterized protein Yka (UPF0111/DUF47 family)